MSEEINLDELDKNERVQTCVRELGIETVPEIAQEADASPAYVNSTLRGLIDEGLVERDKSGKTHRYHWLDEPKQVEEEDDGALGEFVASSPSADEGPTEVSELEEMNTTAKDSAFRTPANRGYDWSEWLPENQREGGIPEYYETENELSEIRATLQNRDKTDSPSVFWVSGPTGGGKTHLAWYVADQAPGIDGYDSLPIFEIQLREGTDEIDLLGRPIAVGTDTVWQDGPLPKGYLASQEMPAVVLFDEGNRAPPRSKGTILEALGERAQVTLDKRGGEKVRADPHNLIVFFTTNEGPGHFVEKIDLAERRRLSAKFDLDYLGENKPEQEIDLIKERTDIGDMLATSMVEVANEVREQANDPGEDVQRPMPTGLVLNWAHKARDYVQHNEKLKMEDLDASEFKEEKIVDPVTTAAVRGILKPFYHDDAGREIISNMMSDYYDGLEGTSDSAWEAHHKGEEITDDIP